MKKQLRKALSHFLPKGGMKDRLKKTYYNFMAPADTTFEAVRHPSGTIYRTTYRNLVFNTIDPLYHITPDFDFYTHFHKIRPGDVVMDAGANRGYIALYFARIAGEAGRVHAFEPDAYNIKTIRRNIELNPDLTNIEVSDLLLWNEDTKIAFYEAGTVGSSAHWIPDNDKAVMKNAVSIDSWVRSNNISKLDFIKMDIEGAEIEAVEGASETIKNLQPDFAIASYHIVNGEPTYIRLEKMFSEMNYPYKTIKFKPTEIITFAGPSVNH